MKFILSLVLMLIIALSFSACSLSQVKGEIGGVEVDVKAKDGKSNNNGKFCPPGQAKKGRC